MRNRALQVRMVKDDKTVADSTSNEDFATKLQVAADVARSLGKDVALGMCAWVVLDTARKVAVALAEK